MINIYLSAPNMTGRGAILNFLLDNPIDMKFGKGVLIKQQNHKRNPQDPRKKGVLFRSVFFYSPINKKFDIYD